jgi:hypothetical protein
MPQFLDHLADDVLPPLLDRLSSEPQKLRIECKLHLNCTQTDLWSPLFSVANTLNSHETAVLQEAYSVLRGLRPSRWPTLPRQQSVRRSALHRFSSYSQIFFA